MSEQERLRLRDALDAVRKAWHDESDELDDVVERLYEIVENDEDEFRKAMKFLTKLGIV